MGPPQRVKYNAKARQSAAGGQARKKRKIEEVDSSNVEMIVPQEAKEAKARRDALFKEMRDGMTQDSVSNKKKKRMEKYIDKKLAQEERQHLLYKLADTQGTSNALNLQSSSKLGTGKAETHQQQLEKQEHLEVTRLIRKGNKRGRRTGPLSDRSDDSDEDDFLESGSKAGPSKLPLAGQTRPPTVIETPKTTPADPTADTATIQTITLGSALARDASGKVIAPHVTKRKKKAKAKKWNIPKRTLLGGPEEMDEDDEGASSFDSSDSAFDDKLDVESGEGEECEWGGIDDGSGNETENGSGGEEDEDRNEDSSGTDTEEDSPSELEVKKPNFKDWAKRQVDIARGFVDDIEEPKVSEGSEQSAPRPSEQLISTHSNQSFQKIAPSSHTLPETLSGPLGSTLPSTQSTFAQAILPLLSHPLLKPLPTVIRTPTINEARLNLPILDEEQQITETILLNTIVILQGETGSGKTSQVVQFLWESGFGRVERELEGQPEESGSGVGSKFTSGKDNKKGRKGVGFGGIIGITQPRRVAAISMSKRVAEELTPPHPKTASASLPPSPVAHQIRYSTTLTKDTRIKFMTEGILLRELSGDFLLRGYSVLVLDEAHERSLGIDVLLGCLTRVVGLRERLWREDQVVDGWRVQPLRLIIMSATLSLTTLLDNKRLFPAPPPIISIPARQHPLTIHFSRRTEPDYVKEALKKVLKIHRRLPPGGVLVFLTGQREIEHVVSKLSAIGKGRNGGTVTGPKPRERRNQEQNQDSLSAKQADVEIDDIEFGIDRKDDSAQADKIDERTDAATDYDPEALDSDEDELDKELGIETENIESDAPLHVIPLFSLLPPEKQMQVFQPPPDGARLVVVATNVAETSLTIPGIRYVVDCGRAKERQYDPSSGIQSFSVTWISKASAQQRAGRAGRTGPGHVYRLYSSAVFENFFSKDTEPEILRMPIEGVVLTMKSMGIDSVVNFPFPSQPDRQRLIQAEKVLAHLGALREVAKGEAQITELGKNMSLFPLAPRYAKMLVVGRQHGCLPYIIAIVSALSVGDPFLPEESLFGHKDDDEREALDDDETPKGEQRRQVRKAYFASKERHSSLGNHTSDVFKYLSVVGAYEFAGGSHTFCEEQFVRAKAMEEIHKLRAQIHDIVKTGLPNESCEFKPNLQPPTEAQMKAIRQMITAGFIDQVAIRADLADRPELRGTKFATCKNVAYRALGINEPVFIHPTSVLFPNPPPPFLCFQDIVRTSKPWMKNLTTVNPVWLHILGPTLCTFSTKKQVASNKLISSTSVISIPHFGPEGWELPPIKGKT